MDCFYEKIKKAAVNAYYHLWAPQKLSDPILQGIKQDRDRIRSLVKDLNDYRILINHKESLLDSITSSMNAMVWKKDKDFKFLMANETHCSTFFGFSDRIECINSIKGRTYRELLEEFNETITRELCNSCHLSDEYVAQCGGTHHFIEAAKISEQDKLLYIMKAAQTSPDGEFEGINGIAWDLTHLSHFMVNFLNRLIYDNKALCIYRNQNIFNYLITPDRIECNVFNIISHSDDVVNMSSECN